MIVRSLSKVEEYFNGKSYFNLFLILLSVKLVFSTTGSLLITLIDPSLIQGGQNGTTNIWKIFVLSIIVAPIFETLIFQSAVIEVGKSMKVDDPKLLLISSFLFGLSHFYNWVYFSFELVVGLIYAYSYLLARNRYDTFKAFLLVFLLHFIHNVISFLNNNVFKFF